MIKGRYCIAVLVAFGTLLGFGCSTKKNTAATRAYHELTTRYNVYFNAEEAYNEALKQIYDTPKDNYDELLPMYPNSSTPEDTVLKTQMGGPFDRVVEKTTKAINEHSISAKPIRDRSKISSQEYRNWLRQNEYNPFIDQAWLLLGKAHVQNKDYAQAIAVFQQTTRLFNYDIDVVSEAQIWMMRAYTEMRWYSDAQSLVLTLQTRNLPKNLRAQFVEFYSFLLIRQTQFEQAIPFLKETIGHAPDGTRRKRLQFLLGQIYGLLGDKKSAYQAFESLKGLSASYDLTFHALMAQAKVSSENAGSIIAHLTQISKSRKNKDYLHRIYAAIGNTYLAQNNPEKAIENFLLAEKNSSEDALQKALIQIALADLYFDRKNFIAAESLYAQALPMLPRSSKDYARIEFRAGALKELVPHLVTIHTQDSLLHLAQLSPEEQLRVIGERIGKLKTAQRDAERDSYLAQQQARFAPLNEQQPSVAESVVALTNRNGGETEFYFYNPQAVAQGKNEFRRIWGPRSLQDNWRLASRISGTQGQSKQSTDSAAAQQFAQNEATTDVYNPQYYLRQIPVSEEAKKQAHDAIDKALVEGGTSATNRLEDFDYALQLFTRHLEEYPQSENRQEVYYRLFQLYTRTGNRVIAQSYKAKIVAEYPESEYASTMSNPLYEQSLTHFAQMQDSIYQDTYQAYVGGNIEKVHRNYSMAEKLFRNGNLISKFRLLHALAFAQKGDRENLESALSKLLNHDKESLEAQLGQSILNGLSEGKMLAVNANALSGIGERSFAQSTTNVSDTIGFSSEKNTPHSYLLLFSGNAARRRNDLLFAVADFNFSRFQIRTFSIDFLRIPPLEAIQVAPFGSFDEAVFYAQMVESDSLLGARTSSGIVSLIISDSNLELLYGTRSIDEYREFYVRELHSGNVVLPEAEVQPEKTETIEIPESIVEPEKTVSLGSEASETENKTTNSTVPIEVQPGRTELATPHLSVEEQKNILETKAEEALRQQTSEMPQQNRNDLLKERDRERQARIKQRDRELKDREKARKEELKQRERERKQKLKEQEALRKEIQLFGLHL